MTGNYFAVLTPTDHGLEVACLYKAEEESAVMRKYAEDSRKLGKSILVPVLAYNLVGPPEKVYKSW